MNKITLNTKEKELLNLGISIAAGCQPCTRYHIKKCRETGMTDMSILNVIQSTERICKKAIEIITTEALRTLASDNKKDAIFHFHMDNKLDVLIGLAVAYSLNSCVLFEKFLNTALKLGITSNEVSEIIEITKFIYSKAKAHIEILGDEYGVELVSNNTGQGSSGCQC